MSFSINTNIASLQAQNYLTQSSAFQSQTIGEVTSGLRIVNSGDDAAGLAVANGMASDQAVLNQGIQNAQNGLSTMQTIDGGMSNINTLLDRAQTLAAESASGTFTGNRATLDQEFQSVLSEINRQAQSIGLNSGGTFAKSMSVYIGGGKGSTAAASTANGQIAIDLSNSAIDAKSLGLTGYTAGYQVASGSADTGLYDLGSASSTSVAKIISTNSATSTSFVISGAGFSDTNAITVNVNLSGVSDTTSLVNAINAALTSAGSTGTAAANSFKAANITATVHTGTDGHQQLLFSSSNSAFTIAAQDVTGNGFLGNLGTNTGGSAASATATGEALANSSVFVAGGTNQLSNTFTASATATQNLTFSAKAADGSQQTTTVSLAAADLTTATSAVAAINAKLQATDQSALQGIIAVASQDGSTITFESSGSFSMTPGASGVVASKGLNEASADTIQTSSVVGEGANASIATASGAQAAIVALTSAVQLFGTAQAAVGRGENNLNYAISLAQSEVTNEAAAESTIKDANLATEAANLTKAQILMQAGTAALAQANSAPQTLLTLLQHG